MVKPPEVSRKPPSKPSPLISGATSPLTIKATEDADGEADAMLAESHPHPTIAFIPTSSTIASRDSIVGPSSSSDKRESVSLPSSSVAPNKSFISPSTHKASEEEVNQISMCLLLPSSHTVFSLCYDRNEHLIKQKQLPLLVLPQQQRVLEKLFG